MHADDTRVGRVKPEEKQAPSATEDDFIQESRSPIFSRGRVVSSLRVEPASPIFALKCLPKALRFEVPDHADILACTVGRAVVVHLCEDRSPRPKFIELRRFEDANVDEEFYAISWSALIRDERLMEHLILAAAGKTGIIRIVAPLDPARGVLRVLTGHGDQVNELAFHPIDGHLLLSASQDKSIRIWNAVTGYCVCILGGPDGHGGGILSLDVHVLGHTVASGGMDNAVKLWSLEKRSLQLAVERSYGAGESYRPSYVRSARFSTQQAHQNYVDCVRFVGNLLVSKCADNVFRVWRPALERGASGIVVLREVHLGDASVWFVRFDVSRSLNAIAVGNSDGLPSVLDLEREAPEGKIVVKPPALVRPSCVRMCSWGTKDH
eukprot:scaffold7870_cov267-Pinguiococcus_pyrenoidosus.AAC.1